jgi:hypothetical protein
MDLTIAYEHNQLCSYLLNAETHEEFVERRNASRSEWRSLSTFSLRLYGMIKEIGLDQSLQHRLEDREIHEFTRNMRDTRLNMKAFLRQENFYRREAKDLVYQNGPMKTVIPLFPEVTTAGRRYWFEQTRDMQEHDSGTPEQFQELLNWVLDPERPLKPPVMDLVADDPWIIREIAASPEEEAFAIVTDDIELCREAHRKTRKWVVRVPPKWWYVSVYFGEGDEPWLGKLSKHYPQYKWKTIEDSGSIKSYEEVGWRDGELLQWPASRPFSLTQVSIRGGRRIRAGRTDPPVVETVWEPYRFPEGYLFVYSNFLNKRKHPHRRGWA